MKDISVFHGIDELDHDSIKKELERLVDSLEQWNKSNSFHLHSNGFFTCYEISEDDELRLKCVLGDLSEVFVILCCPFCGYRSKNPGRDPS